MPKLGLLANRFVKWIVMKRKYTYGVYVIEINNDPKHVYVGQSSKTPEERLKQHMAGDYEHKSARVFKRGAKGKLRPDLYAYLERFATQAEAEEMEWLLARDLREEGFKVEGGH